jgi:hypothetical protein
VLRVDGVADLGAIKYNGPDGPVPFDPDAHSRSGFSSAPVIMRFLDVRITKRAIPSAKRPGGSGAAAGSG